MYKEFKLNQRESSSINKILLIAFMLSIIVTMVIGIMADEHESNNNKVYRSEAQFRKYADDQLDVAEAFELKNVEKTEYEYGEPLSYAAEYSKCEDENISAFRDLKITAIKDAYTSETASITDENDQGKQEDKVKSLLVKSGVFDSNSGVTNMAIYEQTSIENGKEMMIDHSGIQTYQFSQKTGDLMMAPQIFKEEYRGFCSEYFIDYFDKNYSDDELVEDWQKQLEPTPENFNKFIVTQTGVTFFFDEGTVLNKSEGLTYAGLTSVQAKKILRKKILERYIDPARPMVALTYDDGPGLEAEDRILTCLENNNAVATFFYQGAFISGREDKIKRAKKLGCEIGHHTWNHPVLTDLTDAEVNAQIANTSNAIYAACGSYPTVFRPSYGITNSKINTMSGMPVIMWSVDTLDWESRDGKKIFDHVKSIGNLDGHIVLMHSIHDSTADATDMIIPWLKSQGYQLVTVTELIKYKTGADPVPGKTYRTYE